MSRPKTFVMMLVVDHKWKFVHSLCVVCYVSRSASKNISTGTLVG